MKTRNALPEDLEFILKLTRQNMEKIVTREWNADWEKDVEPNFINALETQGKKKIIDQELAHPPYLCQTFCTVQNHISS